MSSLRAPLTQARRPDPAPVCSLCRRTQRIFIRCCCSPVWPYASTFTRGGQDYFFERPNLVLVVCSISSHSPACACCIYSRASLVIPRVVQLTRRSTFEQYLLGGLHYPPVGVERNDYLMYNRIKSQLCIQSSVGFPVRCLL
ncbi:hypothetical protein EXIGLDRAFT_314998 [Exidia glandulosa HHB12029]|uniref:Uncharacterized protein n=1 Tax=Exidia glandulosa HHB12029 TaxID=1314781 RepID=A0A165ZK67_EXIGL|nr:hypothetical protein EXIGLDRAFT_314998 [Exidia glandulosa HHB12029]